MSKKNKSFTLAMVSMVSGIACMPAAAFISTVFGVFLASLSVYTIYLSSD